MHAGDPGQPQNLAILNQPVRIYGPSATNTLNLQASLPSRCVLRMLYRP